MVCWVRTRYNTATKSLTAQGNSTKVDYGNCYKLQNVITFSPDPASELIGFVEKTSRDFIFRSAAVPNPLQEKQ